ncbi:MAG TPA: hypothetical protein VFR86_25025 [Burkholderiaceae bacterium]|nr:hypothetical protein [Burkholderiaceae bacterium]
MTQHAANKARTLLVRAFFYAAAVAGAGCGGSSNPLDNPPNVENGAGAQGRRLSFAYYQRCINPIFLANIDNTTCAASGCHDNANGTGGAFRVIPGAATVDLANAANTPDVIRASDMYKNFYSSQGSVVIGAPLESRLLNKPLVRGVLHGGGLILTSAQDPNARLIEFWINRPAAQGQDEFSSDPSPGTCNTQ